MAACWHATRSGAGRFPASPYCRKGVPLYITYTGPDTLGLGGGTNNRPNLVSPSSIPKKVERMVHSSFFADPVAPWNGGPTRASAAPGKDAVVGPGISTGTSPCSRPFRSTERGTEDRTALRVVQYLQPHQFPEHRYPQPRRKLRLRNRRLRSANSGARR